MRTRNCPYLNIEDALYSSHGCYYTNPFLNKTVITLSNKYEIIIEYCLKDFNKVDKF